MTDTRDPEALSVAELPPAVRARAAAAGASGALVSLPTRVHELVDAGVHFAVRVTGYSARKPATDAAADPAHDPFAPPWEPELLVGAVSTTHVALLNKYNVLPEHLLLVTREDRPQTELLDATDFEAVLIALAAFDGLAFYNGGPDAGASQPHKHLQLVPLPLAPATPLPFAPLLAAAELVDDVGHCPGLPFPHAVAPVPATWWREPAAHADAALATWQRLWRTLGHVVEPRGDQPEPYNLLLTRDWMWLVPRRCAESAGVAVNALGYAGALLVRDETGLEALRHVGPLRLLATTARPAAS